MLLPVEGPLMTALKVVSKQEQVTDKDAAGCWV